MYEVAGWNGNDKRALINVRDCMDFDGVYRRCGSRLAWSGRYSRPNTRSSVGWDMAGLVLKWAGIDFSPARLALSMILRDGYSLMIALRYDMSGSSG